ncbi:proclotting enzyme [Schistocerca nitens]|uniref:proclotting enzyme n=1 Tax=Schistocerca nitens TaxID=7011 RepID=UPI0021192CDA|nr:proclotting enzyme [Schistocerca nitens]
MACAAICRMVAVLILIGAVLATAANNATRVKRQATYDSGSGRWVFPESGGDREARWPARRYGQPPAAYGYRPGWQDGGAAWGEQRHFGRRLPDEGAGESGRLLAVSPDQLATISETLGALNTVGRFLVRAARHEGPPAGDPAAGHGDAASQQLPAAILTLSKNVLGRNLTDAIAPIVRGALPAVVSAANADDRVGEDAASPDARACRTPTGGRGVCDDLSECPQLLLHLSQLRDSICFKSLFTPGVCCPADDDSVVTQRPTQLVTVRPLTSTTRRTTTTTSTTRKPIILPITPPPVYPVATSTRFPALIATDGECGQPEIPGFRVVGGEPAAPGRWPWMAAILLHGNRRTEFWCGGTLIGARHVLTAAHCTRDSRQRPFSPSQLTVLMGDIDLKRQDEPSQPEQYKVVQVKAHPKFNRVGYYHDIALLELERPVRRSRYSIPICLPGNELRDEPFVGTRPTVVGWGSTHYGGRESTVQRQASIPVWRNEDCDRRYLQDITENFICAGYAQGGKDACQGDSGGPLMLEQDAHWIQIGIVSFGNKCGEPGYPGVYTRVTHYLDWIKENMIE